MKRNIINLKQLLIILSSKTVLFDSAQYLEYENFYIFNNEIFAVGANDNHYLGQILAGKTTSGTPIIINS